MASIKKVKATRAHSINKKSKHAPKSLKNTESSKTDASAAPAASPSTPPTPLGFFSLPPELRNNIYRYALVSDDPIKVQFYRSQRGRRGSHCRFTMLPALATVSKQVRLESQRVLFEDNQFETTLDMSKPRDLAPLIAFQKLHQRLGTGIRSLRVCHEVKKRCDGDLFQLKGCFTVSKAGTKLSISGEAYSATYLGRTPRGQAVPYTFVCGCSVRFSAGRFEKRRDAGDIVKFLVDLREDSYIGARSCQLVDVARYDEVVQRGHACNACQRHGMRYVSF